MTYVITDACIDVKDKTCVEECPVDCIYEGERKLYIQPDECIDCGACEPLCPVDAIYYEDHLPEDQRWHKESNAAFFVTLGMPGGAVAVGKTSNDPPEIMELPSRNGGGE